MMDKFLSTKHELNLTNGSSTSDAHIVYTDRLHTKNSFS
jgi:hypothetical protein